MLRGSITAYQGKMNCHFCYFVIKRQRIEQMEKALRETQALRAGCSKAGTKKNSARRRPISRGVRRPKFNQLETVTTFIQKKPVW